MTTDDQISPAAEMNDDQVSPAAGMSERQASRLAVRLIAIGVIMLVVGVALAEYRSRGAEGINGVAVANRPAEAERRSSPAPAFSLPALTGTGRLGLASFPGKTIVLNFWASWCGPCRREAPGLQRTWEAFRTRGVQFLGVDLLDDEPAARAFLKEFRITYPSVSDPSGSLVDGYGVFGLPTTYLIDPSGTIRYRFVGYTDEASLRTTLAEMLAESPS